MRFLDFFAGIGGFRLGMEMAGHECVGHCEIDKYADASYRMMHTVTEEQRQKLLEMPFKERLTEVRKEEYTNGEWYADDITRVRADDLPEAEVYCFGFPCQSFSIAGKRGGFSDTRGTLFFEVMRLAEVRRPEYLFAENVRGLLNHDGGYTFETIIRSMVELGYGVEWQVCNSKYFGVPQNRERVFLIGHLGGISGSEIFPLGAYSEEAVELQGQPTDNGIIVYDDYNSKVRTDGVVGTVTPNFGNNAPRNGTKLIVSNTLSAGDRNSAGTYVADRQTDRQTFLKVNGHHKE